MFNIRDYGGVGDGVADDGPAFNAAAQAAIVAGGGVVYLPNGRWRMATNSVVANPNPWEIRLIVQGEGSGTVVIPNTPTAFFMWNFLGWDVKLKDISFDGGSVGGGQPVGTANSTADYLLGFSNCHAELDGVTFNHVTTPDGLVSSRDGHMTVRRVTIQPITVVTNTIAPSNAYFYNDASVGGWRSFRAFESRLAEGAVVYPNTGSIVYFGTPQYPINDSSEQATVDIGNSAFGSASAFSQIYFNTPAGTRVNRIWIHDSTFNVIDHGASFNGTLMGPVYVQRADFVKLQRLWSGWGGVSTYRSAYYFYDAGDVVVDNCQLDPDNYYGQVVFQGAGDIFADAVTKSLSVIETNYQTITSSCPTKVTRHGIVCRSRNGTLVGGGGQIVKINPSDSRVVPLATTDDQAKVFGVALEGTARASGALTFNAALDIVEGDYFQIGDGVNPLTTIKFSLNGTVYVGVITVQLLNTMTADQRAVATALAANAAHGSGFQITATSPGGGMGQVVFTNDNEGPIGNVVTSAPGAMGTNPGSYVWHGMGGGRLAIAVCEQRGQEVSVVSDGTQAILVGDLLLPSTLSSGAMAKTSSDMPTGIATSVAPATSGASFSMLLR